MAIMEGDAGRQTIMRTLRAKEHARAGVGESSLDSIRKDSDMPAMTPAAIRAVAVAHGGYETPELNDKLFLHFKGYRRIENLGPYTALKALWLDSNGLTVIEGLSHLSQLRCLYLQNNLLERIQGLEGLTSLVTLDLSQNRIFKLENLSCLPALETLNVGRNFLKGPESFDHLKECAALTNVDLSNNSIEDPSIIDGVLAVMPRLLALNLNGNSVVTTTPQFRKKAICAMPKLRYLDRPIFELERSACEAWGKGGKDAETAAREAYAMKKRDEHKEQLQEYRDWVANIRKKKEDERTQRQQQAENNLPSSSSPSSPSSATAGIGSAVTSSAGAAASGRGEERGAGASAAAGSGDGESEGPSMRPKALLREKSTEELEDIARREAREIAARALAERERAILNDPNGIKKLGSVFWAEQSNGKELDVFGHPRSDVGLRTYVSTVEDNTSAAGCACERRCEMDAKRALGVDGGADEMDHDDTCADHNHCHHNTDNNHDHHHVCPVDNRAVNSPGLPPLLDVEEGRMGIEQQLLTLHELPPLIDDGSGSDVDGCLHSPKWLGLAEDAEATPHVCEGSGTAEGSIRDVMNDVTAVGAIPPLMERLFSTSTAGASEEDVMLELD